MDICCTLVSGRYFYGAAGLVNSLAKAGFAGEVVIGHTGEVPAWWRVPAGATAPKVTFIPVNPGLHLGYFKPAFLQRVLAERPDCERLCWFDADICITVPWHFMRDWIDAGLALCADCVLNDVSPNHPWRTAWRQLLERANVPENPGFTAFYANSGFIGASRANLAIYEIWAKLVEAFREGGGDIQRSHLADRPRPVTGDQDLLAAALMGFPGALCPIGREGMGFEDFPLMMSHGVESTKPWDRIALVDVLIGCGVSRYRKLWRFHLSHGPIVPESGWTRVLRGLDLKAAIFLARVWKR